VSESALIAPASLSVSTLSSPAPIMPQAVHAEDDVWKLEIPGVGVEDHPTAYAPSFIPSAYDIIFENSLLLDRTQVMHLRRGHNFLKVMLPRATPRSAHFVPGWCRGSRESSGNQSLDEDHLEQEHGLEVCRSLLHALPFGHANSVYLTRDRSGSWKCVPRQLPPKPLFEPWGEFPLVDESEIRYTRFSVMPDIHEAVWEGYEVDIWSPRPCTPAEEFEALDFAAAYRDIGTLPYKFEILAFLTRDGLIAGMIFEPSGGRPVRLSDRAVVYAAFADLERHGLMCRWISEFDLVIAEDGLPKFTWLTRVHSVGTDLVQAQEDLHIWHWGKLREMFARLEEKRGYRLNYKHLRVSRYHPASSTLLFPLPAPSPLLDQLSLQQDWLQAVILGMDRIRLDEAVSFGSKRRRVVVRPVARVTVTGEARSVVAREAAQHEFHPGHAHRRRRSRSIAGSDHSSDTASEPDTHRVLPPRVTPSVAARESSEQALGSVLAA
jgi:hypothetical protein